MRPTLWQIYCNPKAIITALEVAGVENAHAKVMRLMDDLSEYWSMHRYVSRIDRDRTHTHQSEARRLRWPTAKPDPAQVMRNLKQVAEYDRTLVVARGYLKRTGAKLERKIDKWPDLNLEGVKLRKRPDFKVVDSVLKKRRRKNRPRTPVLG